uniref:ATP-binding protein n=1 Tax=Paraburkholderia fungorum TaxID=134537 RepID=UPI0038B73B66
MPEFERHVLETLREPLEAGRITISRAALQADFPAACQLIPTAVAAAICANSRGRCSTGSTFRSRFPRLRRRSCRHAPASPVNRARRSHCGSMPLASGN